MSDNESHASPAMARPEMRDMSTGADRSISAFGFGENTPIGTVPPPTPEQTLIERQSLRELSLQREEELLRAAEERHRSELEQQRAYLEQAFREDQRETLRKAQAELQIQMLTQAKEHEQQQSKL